MRAVQLQQGMTAEVKSTVRLGVQDVHTRNPICVLFDLAFHDFAGLQGDEVWQNCGRLGSILFLRL